MAISKTIPTYRQLNPGGFFCEADFMIMEGEAFEYEGQPNEFMEALNEPAREKLVEFYKKIDEGARAVAEKNGRMYSPHTMGLDVLVAQATADARRVELRPGDGGIPLMGAKKDIKIKKVSLENSTPVYSRGVTGGHAA